MFIEPLEPSMVICGQVVGLTARAMMESLGPMEIHDGHASTAVGLATGDATGVAPFAMGVDQPIRPSEQSTSNARTLELCERVVILEPP